MPQVLSIPMGWDDPILTRTEAEALLAQQGYVLLADPQGGHLLGVALEGGMADIITLYVPEERRRQGVARRLMDQFMVAARSVGSAGLTLEVRADNDAAIALYKSLGLREEMQRKMYYPDGTDALVLSCQFT